MIEPFLRLAYTDGIEVLLHVDARSMSCDTHGFPDSLLEEYTESPLPLRLSFNELHVKQGCDIDFHEDRIEVTVGFDQLYRVTIPYSLISQFAFLNPGYCPRAVPDDLDEDEEEELEEAESTGAPFLKLV